MNVTKESLEAKHGANAGNVFQEIAQLGGYGNVPANYSGGLDIFSALDPSNTVLSDATKDRIAELSGVKRKEADKLFNSGTIITSEQVKDNKV